MRLIADTHVHIYPFYDTKLALHSLRTNLSQLDSQAVCMLFLAERSDCHFFADFAKNTAKLFNPESTIRYLKDALHIQESGYPDLYIFPGRQIITRERIEILSLTVDTQIADGLPANELVEKIRQHQGVPVLSWAPGKWFFKRKKIVRELIDTNDPGSLLIGDTSLRPTCWLQPRLMKRAASKGLTIISGSDPLPFAGEEQLLGQYGIQLDCDFDPDDPVSSVRSILSQPQYQPSLMGKRGNLLTTFRRLFKNNRAKKG